MNERGCIGKIVQFIYRPYIKSVFTFGVLAHLPRLPVLLLHKGLSDLTTKASICFIKVIRTLFCKIFLVEWTLQNFCFFNDATQRPRFLSKVFLSVISGCCCDYGEFKSLFHVFVYMFGGSELCNWYNFNAEISDRHTFSLVGVWLATEAWPNKTHQQTLKNLGQFKSNIIVEFNFYEVP